MSQHAFPISHGSSLADQVTEDSPAPEHVPLMNESSACDWLKNSRFPCCANKSRVSFRNHVLSNRHMKFVPEHVKRHIEVWVCPAWPSCKYAVYRKCSAVPHAKQCQHRKVGTPSTPWSRIGWPTRDDRPPSLASTSGDGREEDTILVHTSSEPTHATASSSSNTRYSPYDKVHRSCPLADLSNFQHQTFCGDHIDYKFELPSMPSPSDAQLAIPTVPPQALSMPLMGELIFDVEDLTPPSDGYSGPFVEPPSNKGFLLSSSTSLESCSEDTSMPLMFEDNYLSLLAGGGPTFDHDSPSVDWLLQSYPIATDNLTVGSQNYSASSDYQPERTPYLDASSLEPSLPTSAYLSRLVDETSPLLEDYHQIATGSSALEVDTSSFDWLFS